MRDLPVTAGPSPMPPIHELGTDLLHVTAWKRWRAVALPFLCCGLYAVFAALGWWGPAVLAVMGFSFFTYGPVSHELVHRILGLPRAANEVLLCVLELLALRSGHAYRAAHLHHHARFPHPDDVEARAAGRSWAGALAEGLVFQVRVWV